jgi:hypothetical protein
VVCAQTLEHFYSHLAPVREMRQVLRGRHPWWMSRMRFAGGTGSGSCRNRSRGITASITSRRTGAVQRKHFFPDRHNRDFTLEVRILLLEAGFQILGPITSSPGTGRVSIPCVRSDQRCVIACRRFASRSSRLE